MVPSEQLPLPDVAHCPPPRQVVPEAQQKPSPQSVSDPQEGGCTHEPAEQVVPEGQQ